MDEPTIKQFTQRIAVLEAAVESLKEQLEKEVKHNANMDRLNSELRGLIEADVIDALERVKNIELKVFPNLVRDIIEVNKIIGTGDDNRWNPLDHRPPPRS